MYLYLLETKSGQSFISYVEAAADRFFENNKDNIDYFRVYNTQAMDFYFQVNDTLPKEKADEVIGYWEWMRSLGEGQNDYRL